MTSTDIMDVVFKKAIHKHETLYAQISQAHGGGYIPSSDVISFFDRSFLTPITKDIDFELVWKLHDSYKEIRKDYNTLSAFISSKNLVQDFTYNSLYLLPDFLLNILHTKSPPLSLANQEIRNEFLKEYYTDEIQALLIKHIIILR